MVKKEKVRKGEKRRTSPRTKKESRLKLNEESKLSTFCIIGGCDRGIESITDTGEYCKFHYDISDIGMSLLKTIEVRVIKL